MVAVRFSAPTIKQMMTLAAEQRNQLLQIVAGKLPGEYVAAVVILNLAEGKDRPFISKATFCTLDEIDRIERAFKESGLEGIRQMKL